MLTSIDFAPTRCIFCLELAIFMERGPSGRTQSSFNTKKLWRQKQKLDFVSFRSQNINIIVKRFYWRKTDWNYAFILFIKKLLSNPFAPPVVKFISSPVRIMTFNLLFLFRELPSTFRFVKPYFFFLGRSIIKNKIFKKFWFSLKH